MSNFRSPIRTIQTDFRSGEVDPLLAMRVDSKVYPSGAKTLRNCIIRAGGSVSRRPGSTRLLTLAAKRRLFGFEFDVDEKYILSFGVSHLTVYDADGQTISSFSNASCPWDTLDKVAQITAAQAGDTMIICHPSFRPKVLKRTSLTSFTLTDYLFTRSVNDSAIYQPYIKFEPAAVTLLTSSTDVGTGRTITASSPIFSAAWVGDTIRIQGNEVTITAYTSPTVVVGTVKRKIERYLDANPLRSTALLKTIEVTHPFHGMVSGAQVGVSGADPGTSGISAGNINVPQGRTITVLDEDRYTYEAENDDKADLSVDFGGVSVRINCTAPTRDWRESVFSNRRGWPAAVCFHEDRLWFGGSTTLPDGLFGSETGLYYNFDVGEGEDDKSIQVTLGSPRVARIKHILAGPVLQIFTEGAEFVARQSDGVALTPSTISVRPQTPYGCTEVQPRSFDGATIFIQANRKTVR